MLRDVEGLSTQEAAEIAGVGQAAFKSRLHQARLRVRAAIGDDALVAAAPLLVPWSPNSWPPWRSRRRTLEQLGHRTAHSGEGDNRQADPPAQPSVQGEDVVDRRPGPATPRAAAVRPMTRTYS